MSYTIESGKETGLIQIGVVPRPLILCQIVAPGGDTVYLCTSPAAGGSTLVYGGNTYLARLIDNPVDQIQAMSPQGYDVPGSINLRIADGDLSIWTNHANAHGWRGGVLTVSFVLYDLPSAAFSTNAYTWTFILDKPKYANGILSVSAQARQSLTRLSVPNLPRQNRCWNVFPATSAQRAAALNDPTSPYWGCGFSPDQPGGVGNTTTANLTNPDGSALTDASGIYVTCDYTRSCGPNKGVLTQGCMARLGNYSGTLAPDGDIEHDAAGHNTARFTGDTWVAPQGWSGRQYTAGTTWQYGFNTPNPATGTTYYTVGYGTQWVKAAVLAPAGDPNSDRAECVVCVSRVNAVSIQMVVVNGVIIPGNNYDVLFTYRVLSGGGRTGAVNRDAIYNAQGDPHGSQCVIEVVVPQQLAAPGSVMDVQVLVAFGPAMQWSSGSGFHFPISPDSSMIDSTGAVAENPVWALLDLLCQWGPFTSAEIDGQSWYNAAQVCAAQMTYTDATGATQTHARYRLSFAFTNDIRQTLAKAVLGMRNNAGLVLTRNPSNGYLQCSVEQTLADQQPLPVPGSNYNVPVASYTAAGNATLASTINSSVTTIPLSYAMLTVTNQVIQIDSEFMQITGGAGTTSLIVTRNYAGSTAAGHTSGVVVYPCGYLGYLFDGAESIELKTFQIDGRSINDTPNVVAVSFQDSANGYVVDSANTIDVDGYAAAGNQEIQAPLDIIGLENFDQLTRRSNIELAKGNAGNTRFDAKGTEYLKWRSSVKAAHLAGSPGTIVGVKYEQLGL